MTYKADLLPRGRSTGWMCSGLKVHSGSIMVIDIHVSIHELLHTNTGHAWSGECGAL